jgi:hypothetical protein
MLRRTRLEVAPNASRSLDMHNNLSDAYNKKPNAGVYRQLVLG